MPKSLSGSLALSKLFHVPMTCKGQSGEVKGVFIPFNANKLVIVEKKDENNKIVETQVYMPIRIYIKDEDDQFGQCGFLSKSMGSKDYKALGTGDAAKLAAKPFTPILGSFKNFSQSSDSEDSSGNVSDPGETFSPTDDVPF